MSRTVLILNGPGLADTQNYEQVPGSSLSLAVIGDACEVLADELDLELDFRQTDDPDELSQWITVDSDQCDGLIVNPAGRSGTASEAVRQYRAAIRMAAGIRPGERKKPIIEVQLGNIFRPASGSDHDAYIATPGVGLVCGLGKFGYLLAMRSIARDLAPQSGADTRATAT